MSEAGESYVFLWPLNSSELPRSICAAPCREFMCLREGAEALELCFDFRDTLLHSGPSFIFKEQNLIVLNCPLLTWTELCFAVDTAEEQGCWPSTSARGSTRPAAATPGSRLECQCMQRLAVNSLWGMGTSSRGFLSGDLWEQESGINGFAERFAVGTVLGCQRKAPGGSLRPLCCRPCRRPRAWRAAGKAPKLGARGGLSVGGKGAAGLGAAQGAAAL